jgi:hypothetical protein
MYMKLFMMRLRRILYLRTGLLYAFSLFLLLPVCAHAEVVINEIAWMGTVADANDEWIELYNGGSSISVTGWTLSDGGSINITLAGTIAAGEYALLERTDDNAVPDIPMFQSYAGALANTGKTLILRDASGATLDEVVGGENWTNIGGDNVTKDTPQRSADGTWRTAVPTPGAQNATTGTTPHETESTTTTTETTSNTETAPRSGGRIVYGTKVLHERVEPEALTLSIDARRIAYVNQEVSFTAHPHGPGKTIINSLAYAWNFGDTFTSTAKAPVHTFQYPGEYIVVVDAEYAKQHAQARSEITVLPTSFTVTRGVGGEVVIKNLSSEEVDVGGFALQDTPFVFPKFTVIKAGGTLTVPPTRFFGTQPIALLDGAHASVAAIGAAVRPTPRPAPQVAGVVVPAVAPTASSTVSSTSIPTGIIKIGAPRTEEDTRTTLLTRVFRKLSGFLGF